MSINAKSVEFHQCHAKPHSICFLHNIKDNERNLCHDLLTIENTNSDLKVHELHYANELLVRFRLSFQKTFANSFNMEKQYEKKCLRLQTRINHISIPTFLCFLPQYQRQRKCVFFSERELKKALRDTLTRAAWYGL